MAENVCVPLVRYQKGRQHFAELSKNVRIILKVDLEEILGLRPDSCGPR